jgi:hypothetical protein
LEWLLFDATGVRVAELRMTGVYACLVFLTSAAVVLIYGNHSRRAVHFAAGITFVILAAAVMFVSTILSLWLHPLS